MTQNWLTLGDVLVPQSNGKLLQQGWSPRCHGHPAAPGKWGVLKTTAIQSGWFDPSYNKELPDVLKPRPQLEVKVGDLLITCAGPRVRCGVPTLVRRTPERLLMSGKMYRFRPNEEVLLPKFLELWLLSPDAQERIDEMKTGISESGLNLTHGRFVQLPVPVPPLSEQHRIVGAVEDYLSRLSAAESSLDGAATGLAALGRARPDAGSPMEKLPSYRLKELLREPLRNGHSGRATNSNNGIRALTLSAVTNNEFSDQYTKLTETPIKKARDLWLSSGDIYIQRSNTPELVGSSALYRGQENWAIFPDLLIRVRVDEQKVLPEFMIEVLTSESVRGHLRSKARGLAGSMPKISQGVIENVLVPLPSLTEQAIWVERASEMRDFSSRLLAGIASSKSRSAALRRSLLRAAFNGELVDQDPHDEPAEIALARIRSQPKPTRKRTARRATPAEA